MKRVIFNKNPLIEVILQFRFPAILAINANDPVDFQEAIRQEYPIYQPSTENTQEIQLIANNDSFLPSIVNKQQCKNHEFISADGRYKVNLTSSFISISTVSYEKWEIFWDKFETVLKEFISIYRPAFFERVGLRYIDAISRKQLGIEDKSWKDLIKENWIGPLYTRSDNNVKVLNIDSELLLEDNKTLLKIHTGMGNINNEEKVFIVDTDFIRMDNTKTDEYLSVVNSLHDRSKFFIDDVITEELYKAMDPRNLE